MTLELDGFGQVLDGGLVRVETLTGAANDTNNFTHPLAVAPYSHSATVVDGRVRVSLPAWSLVLLQWRSNVSYQ